MKSFKRKISKAKYSRFFLRQAGICLFSVQNDLTLENKHFVHFRILPVKERQASVGK